MILDEFVERLYCFCCVFRSRGRRGAPRQTHQDSLIVILCWFFDKKRGLTSAFNTRCSTKVFVCVMCAVCRTKRETKYNNISKISQN